MITSTNRITHPVSHVQGSTMEFNRTKATGARLVAPVLAALLLFSVGQGMAIAHGGGDDASPYKSAEQSGATTVETAQPDGVDAIHNGKEVNLVEDGWGTATRCVEYGLDDVVCYDTDEEYAADFEKRTGQEPRDAEGERRNLAEAGKLEAASQVSSLGRTGTYWDCPQYWTCLWDYKNFSAYGRMLQWNEAGEKNLADWDFRDRTSSSFKNRIQTGYKLTEVKTLWPDKNYYFGAGTPYPDFSEFGFNNEADRLTVF